VPFFGIIRETLRESGESKMEQMEKWNQRWNELFKQVRILWINELSPEAFAFMNNIRFFASYLDEKKPILTLFFKTTFLDSSNVVFSIKLFFNIHYVLDNFSFSSQCDNHWLRYYSGKRSRSKAFFTDHDHFLIGEFIEKISNDIHEASALIAQEKNNYHNKLFKEQFIGRTIVGYDEETKHFLLDNDTKINADSAFRFFKSIEEQKLFKEAK